MAGISDILTVSKIAGGAGPGQAAGAIGKFNTVAGTVFNAAGAGSAIVDSVKQLFGGEEAARVGGDEKRSAINNLRSYIGKNDILSNNLFYVEISIPHILTGTHDKMARDLPLLCHSASLPGVSFGTSEVRRYGVGVTEKRPTFPIFTDTTLTFIGDGKGEVRNFFYNWMTNIVKFDGMGSAQKPGDRMAPFEVDYKENYQCQVNIVVLNRANKKIFKVTLVDAFPIALGDQSLSWHDNDSLMSIPVTFTYFNWKCETIDVGGIPAGLTPSASLLGSLVKVGTAIQTLASIKTPRSIGDIVNITKNTSSVINGLKGLL